jgi:hypothetical protein
MVDPRDVDPILNDAARLVREGEIVVFGSAALALWLREAPQTRDVDVWCEPEKNGEILVAVMGEQSWYHRTHGVFIEVWAPETFTAGWRERARIATQPDFPDVRLVIPHPHDVLISKLERFDSKDRDHLERILDEYPLGTEDFDALVELAPHRRGEIDDTERVRRFEHGVGVARKRIEARAD